jgi:ribonuclease E
VIAAPVAAAASEALGAGQPAGPSEGQAPRPDRPDGERGERGGRRSRRGGRRRRGRGDGGGEGFAAGGAVAGAMSEGGFDDDSGSFQAPRDLADVGAAPEAAPREREAVPSPVFSTPRDDAGAPRSLESPSAAATEPPPTYGASPSREPASRSFDFDRPAVPPATAAAPVPVSAPPSAPRETAPVAAPVRERESVATASEPREWTPTPPTDTAPPRDEP